jgi:hypothetical protein
MEIVEKVRSYRMPAFLDQGHEIISGTIGMGKSYYVLYKIIRSFEADRPCAYIDPKGDTYRSLLAFFCLTDRGKRIWEKYRHRIRLVNPVSKSDQIVGFNAIDPLGEFLHANPDKVALVANSLTSHIRRQSGFEISDANRMQNIMAAGIGALVEAGKGDYTLAELPLLYRSYRPKGSKRFVPFNPFVQALLPKIRHHGTYSFWHDQWANWGTNERKAWIQPVEGRVFQHLFDERFLMTVCTKDNATLDFAQAVEDGVWLFVNIPYALLSDTISTLMGNMLITKIFYAAMQRPVGKRSYRLILDEARFFNTGPLDMLLETSRAFNLWLTLVVQSLDQMARMSDGRVDLRLKETALNNARYLSIFHNTADAPLLANLMFPLSGQVVSGQRASGDNEYLPIPAEQDRYQRRFSGLLPREVVLYDKLNPRPKLRHTVGIRVPEASQSQLDLFEAQHLSLTGRPASQIMAEIRDRQEATRSLFRLGGPERSIPPRQMGGLI